jgi:hypothetical protein
MKARGAKILRLLKDAVKKKKKKYGGRMLFILRAFFLLFIGFVISLVIALSQIDIDTFREDITAGLRAATGLPVEIRGDVAWRLSLRPRAVLQDVRIANADWAQNEYGVQVDSVIVTLNILSVFSGRPAIAELRLVDMLMFLEENTDGKFSIEMNRERESTIVRAMADRQTTTADRFPFDLNFGFETIELANPRIVHISPSGTEDWSLTHARIKYKQHGNSVEYIGSIEKDRMEHSFVIAFTELDVARRVYPVRIAVTGRSARLVINTALEMTSRIPIDFVASGTVHDIQKIGALLNMDFPEIPRFDISAAGGMDHSKLMIRRAELRSGNNDMHISGEFDWRGAIPSITANIRSRNLNLKQVAPDIYRPEYPPWVRPDYRELNVFKDTPLYAELMRMANVDLSLDIKNLVVYRELAVRDILARAILRDGALSVNAAAEMGGGEIVGVARGHEQDGTIYARAAGRGRDIVVGDLLTELRTHNFMTGLPSEFEFYFESNGYDLSGLMSNLNGHAVGASTGRGRALRDATDFLYGKDSLTTLRTNVTNVVRKNDAEIVRINCAAANLKVRNGRVETDRGVAVETSEVNIRAQGYVDLGQERLQASMVTMPVRGLRLSVSGNVVNSMEFRGNMAEPDLIVSRAAIVNRAVTATGLGLILAPFTGGLSLAAGAGVGLLTSDLLTNWLADDNPCQTALSDRGAPARRGDPEFMNRPLRELVDEMISGQ